MKRGVLQIANVAGLLVNLATILMYVIYPPLTWRVPFLGTGPQQKKKDWSIFLLVYGYLPDILEQYSTISMLAFVVLAFLCVRIGIYEYILSFVMY